MDIVIYGMLIITVILIGGLISIFLEEAKGILVTIVLFLLFCFFHGGGTVMKLRLPETEVTESSNFDTSSKLSKSIDSSIENEENSLDVTTSSVATTTSSENEDIVVYAKQFVGNPYVWGGDSLTNGCDCSHFVCNVLKDTGHYNGGWVKSTNWQYQGEPVESLENALAGDVIVYDGHVAIYDGKGKIVEARGTAYGITDDRAADAKEIIAIRRFPKNDN